jgi:hypothetical protein
MLLPLRTTCTFLPKQTRTRDFTVIDRRDCPALSSSVHVLEAGAGVNTRGAALVQTLLIGLAVDIDTQIHIFSLTHRSLMTTRSILFPHNQSLTSSPQLVPVIHHAFPFL